MPASTLAAYDALVSDVLMAAPTAEPPHLAASPPDILTCMAEWQRVWSDQTFMTAAFKHFGFSWPMVPQVDPAQQRSGRPGPLLTPVPHGSGRAGSSASGSSIDGFATRMRRRA